MPASGPIRAPIRALDVFGNTRKHNVWCSPHRDCCPDGLSVPLHVHRRHLAGLVVPEKDVVAFRTKEQQVATNVVCNREVGRRKDGGPVAAMGFVLTQDVVRGAGNGLPVGGIPDGVQRPPLAVGAKLTAVLADESLTVSLGKSPTEASSAAATSSSEPGNAIYSTYCRGVTTKSSGKRTLVEWFGQYPVPGGTLTEHHQM